MKRSMFILRGSFFKQISRFLVPYMFYIVQFFLDAAPVFSPALSMIHQVLRCNAVKVFLNAVSWFGTVTSPPGEGWMHLSAVRAGTSPSPSPSSLPVALIEWLCLEFCAGIPKNSIFSVF